MLGIVGYSVCAGIGAAAGTFVRGPLGIVLGGVLIWVGDHVVEEAKKNADGWNSMTAEDYEKQGLQEIEAEKLVREASGTDE
jgi:hypothetical protein